MNIIMHTFTQRLTQDQAFKLPRQHNASCWRGKELPHPFSWGLAIDPSTLWFVAQVPAVATSELIGRQGEFVEGLWESDVAELFLRDSQGRYQEFNVSADGAWWSMTFSAYRERHNRPRKPVPSAVSVRCNSISWTAVLGLEIQSLDVSLLDPLQAHISGIVYEAAAPVYLTSGKALHFDPDFHDQRCFTKIVLQSGTESL